jgi:Flp pilus assembly protein TadB
MVFLFSLISALSFSSVILLLGWRRTTDQAEMSRALGIAAPRRGFDPDKFARQTGTGLTFNQIAIGFAAWTAGGFLVGMIIGPLASFLFGVAGALMYYGTLADRRADHRMQQAEDILRTVGSMAALMESGKMLEEALSKAINGCSPVGQIILGDLAQGLRSGSSGEARALAVNRWAQRWEHPVADVLATLLIVQELEAIRPLPLLKSLNETLTSMVEILSRARSSAKGIEWQAKFLALFPPAIILLVAIVTPEAGRIYSLSPLYLLPVLLGSGLSYWLTTSTIRKGLSLEASMGVQTPVQFDRGQLAEAVPVEYDRLGSSAPKAG